MFKIYSDNWKNLSKQLRTFDGQIVWDNTYRAYSFNLNNITFLIKSSIFSWDIKIIDPKSGTTIDLTDFLPYMNKIVNHIVKLYNAAKEQAYDEADRARKAEAEEILFGKPQ
jgi:hypothetical protein